MVDFDDMLINVRSSYRLLYVFNKKILDLVKYIGNKFNLPYNGGWAKYSNTSPDYGKGNLNLLAWDWLNLYYYEFSFFKEPLRFSIILQCDTGVWDTNADRSKVDKYGKVEISKSRLVFVVSKTGYWDMGGLLESDNWKNDSPSEFIVKDIEKQEKMICKAFEINEFQDEKMTKESLEIFVNYLKKNGINDINISEDL